MKGLSRFDEDLPCARDVLGELMADGLLQRRLGRVEALLLSLRADILQSMDISHDPL
jgi:hypothetical protein